MRELNRTHFECTVCAANYTALLDEVKRLTAERDAFQASAEDRARQIKALANERNGLESRPTDTRAQRGFYPEDRPKSEINCSGPICPTAEDADSAPTCNPQRQTKNLGMCSGR